MNYILALNEQELSCLKTAVKEELKQWGNMRADYKLVFDNTIAQEMVGVADNNIKRLNVLLNKLNSLGAKGKNDALSSN